MKIFLVIIRVFVIIMNVWVTKILIYFLCRLHNLRWIAKSEVVMILMYLCLCNNYGGLMTKILIIVVVIVLDFSVIDLLCYYIDVYYLIKLLKWFKN